MADKAHARSSKVVATNNGHYEMTPGIRQAIRLPMEHAQLARRFPWAVVWFDEEGKRKRLKYSFISEAIRIHNHVVQSYPTATIVSLGRGYDVPAHYRGRLPKPWKWCPFCMKPRKYKALLDPQGNRQTFQYLIAGGERTLLLMGCPTCGQNNRHYMFRRANQEWTLTKIPKGKRRVRRRK